MIWQRSVIAIVALVGVTVTAACKKREGTTPSRAAKTPTSPGILCVDRACFPLARRGGAIRGPVKADSPVAFGYKCVWLAVKTGQTQAVVQALGLTDVRRSGWKTGIEVGHRHGAFVSPPVKGWTLVVSLGLPSLGWPADKTKVVALLGKLSLRFGEVQYYATHRVSEFHAWAVARSGVIVRQFAWAGDEGRATVNAGSPLPEEKRLNVVYKDLNKRWPREQDVMALAGALSVNPTTLSARSAPIATGFVGKVP